MQKVSEKIRNLRLEKKMTLRGLAQSAGISPSALSQIESAQVSPSVATLEKIAAALRLPITVLFDEPEEANDPVLMPAKDRRRVYSAPSHATLEPLARGLSKKKMQPFLLRLDPGGEVGDHPYSGTEGEEFAIVLEGEVLFEQSGRNYTLRDLDAVYFDPMKPHNWKNTGRGPATVLLVSSS
ncbi:MAG: helix-turn-helix domain-containing protein [Leptospirillum sp.]|jgi:transcriptional regulator with XRE-family HTH domain|nr:helix-turn-helix domain-containing protein [Nitrospiraceae bacterium]